MSINPSSAAVDVGDTITVELSIFQADEEFNAFDIFLGFDPAFLTFVPTTPVNNQRGELMTAACANTFHVFTPGASQLSITLSLLCNNVFVTGPGVIYRVKFLANSATSGTSLVCNAGTAFYRAGFGVDPLECGAGSVAISGGPTAVGIGGDAALPAITLGVPRPNPHTGRGAARFDFSLPSSGEVGIELFDAGGRLVARREPARFSAAGAHSISWDPGAIPSGIYFVRISDGRGGGAQTRWHVVR